MEKERSRSFYLNILSTELAVLLLFAIYSWQSGEFVGIYSADEVPFWRMAYLIAGKGDISAFSSFGSASFGYSLLLAPLVLIFGGGTSAYRIALFINALFLASSFVFAYLTARKLFPDVNPYFIKLSAFAVMLLPDIICKAYTTTGFAPTVFFMWATLWLFSNLDLKKKPWYFVLSAVCLSLLLWFCEGALGIFLSGALTVALMLISKRVEKRSAVTFYITAGSGLFIFIVLKIIFSLVCKENAYFSAKSFFAVLSGRIMYTGASTLLFAFAGIGFAVIGSKNFIKSFVLRHIEKVPADEYTDRQLFLMFLLLSSVSYFLTDVISSSVSSGANAVLSGRYGGAMVAPLMLIGIIYIYVSGKKSFIVNGISAGVFLLSSLFFNFSGSAALLSGFSPVLSSSVGAYISKGITSFTLPLVTICVSFGACLVIFLSSKKIKLAAFIPIFAFCALFLCESFSVVNNYAMPVQKQNDTLKKVISASVSYYSAPISFDGDSSLILSRAQFLSQNADKSENNGKRRLVFSTVLLKDCEIVYEDSSGYYILITK